MQMSVKRWLVALLALALVAITAACAQPAAAPAPAAPKAAAPTEAPKAAAPTEAPKAAAPTTAPTAAPAAKATDAPKAAAPATGGKPLVVGLSHDLTTLDPGRGYEIAGGLALKATYSSLVTINSSDISKIEGDLAEKWEFAPDGKSVTFTLRKGVKFASGNELTSADVKWSYERVKGLKGNPSFLFDTIESVEAKDPSTVVLKLTQPDPAILAKMTYSAFSILDSKTVTAQGGVSGPDAKDKDQAQKWLDANSAGSGPYILKSWTKENEIVVDRNPNYFRGPASIERVIYKHLPQTATQKLALEAGDIDISFEINAEQAKALGSNANISIVKGATTDMFFLFGNKNKEMSPNGVMANPKVVQAMRYAVDYEGLKDLAGGAGVTPPTIVGTGFVGAWDESKAPKRDVAKAKQLLTEAGFPSGFAIDLQYPTKFARTGIDFDLLAAKIQADLTEAGFKVTLKPGDLQTELANYRAAKEGLGLWMWGADFPDTNDRLAFLPEGIVGKRMGWTNATSDETIQKLRDQAAVETDPKKRVEVWDKIQAYLVDNSPVVGLIQPARNVAVRKNITGYVYNNVFLVNPYQLTKQ